MTGTRWAWHVIVILTASGWYFIGTRAVACNASRECKEFCASRAAKYDDSRWDTLKGCECSGAKLQTWVRQ